MYNEFDLFNRILNNLVVMVAVIRSAFVGTAVVASVYKESDSFGFSAVTPLLSVLITGLETAAKPFLQIATESTWLLFALLVLLAVGPFIGA